MNETLQNALSQVINAAVANAEAAKGFILEQAPDVCQQLVKYTIAEYCIRMIILFMLTAVATRISYIWVKYTFALNWEKLSWDNKTKIKCNLWDASENAGTAIGIGISCVVSVLLNLALIINCFCYEDAVKAYVAPKVFLIEYAADLVKSQTRNNSSHKL